MVAHDHTTAGDAHPCLPPSYNHTMTTHPDAAALLAAILADPADDSVRLIYADWLEENGEQERAEFIRIQCAIAAWKPYIPPPEIEEIRRSGRLYAYQAGLLIDEKTTEHNQKLITLRERELSLLGEDISDIPGLIKPRYFAWCEESGISPTWVKVRGFGIGADSSPVENGFRRGFVAEIRCTCQDWLDHGPALVRVQPIERVEITDMPIYPSGGNSTYYVGGLGQFPQKFWRELDSLPTRHAAANAISDVALAWAKAQPVEVTT